MERSRCLLTLVNMLSSPVDRAIVTTSRLVPQAGQNLCRGESSLPHFGQNMCWLLLQNQSTWASTMLIQFGSKRIDHTAHNAYCAEWFGLTPPWGVKSRALRPDARHYPAAFSLP